MTPILLVDADCDQNLAEMVGIDVAAAGKKTVAELLCATFIERGGTTIGIPPSHRIENRIWEEGLVEGEHFDLLSVGTKWVEGCYCLPDAALKNALATITRQYRFIIIDAPGGLEHLNRRITGNIDIVFDVMGPSSKSFAHVQRAYRVIREVGIAVDRFYVIGGHAFPDELKSRASAETGLPCPGKIAHDPLVAARVLAGESLLTVPESSRAYQSVAALLAPLLAGE